ncbi:MAG: translation elongation factor 4 [Candidatus Magasanikbacteria bacterium]
MSKENKIKNFSIIAHIDHGKSTLADRFLEMTKTIRDDEMSDQHLDTMDLEQERGITIKLQPVRMKYRDHTLNLIDTPGHVDFNYEVSRSLAAVESVILLVDASQGVQAQTIANLYLAQEQGLEVIPVLNKIDLDNIDLDKRKIELAELLNCDIDDILTCSAKTGEGVEEVLDAVVDRTPPPDISPDSDKLKALIFDSHYDDYRGVVASVRVMQGQAETDEEIELMRSGAETKVLAAGYHSPKMQEKEKLETGQIGYLVTDLKDINKVQVGDTITNQGSPVDKPLPGYKEVKPRVFAGIFPQEGDESKDLRKAIEKLKLSDSALTYRPDHSPALGYGFRCGFLGMLHLEIFQERLEREFDLNIVATVPSVEYKVTKTDGEQINVKSPEDLPERPKIDTIKEPWMDVEILTPEKYIGDVMQLLENKKGNYHTREHLNTDDTQRVILTYKMPLAALITDFYDKLKSASKGYASLSYEFDEYREADVVRMDVLVAEEKVDSLSLLVWEDQAQQVGRKVVESLADTLPRQQFKLKIQAAVGGDIVAAEHLSARRKNVTEDLYGGDVTRKRKLLERQKEQKKKMQQHGSVDIPKEAYMSVLKR